MPRCRDVCLTLDWAKKATRRVNSDMYFCRCCQLFLRTPGPKCPCCHHRLRVRARGVSMSERRLEVPAA